MTSPAFTPFRLGSLTLRNRLIKTATFEGMCTEDGLPSEVLVRHHRELAAGGVGMTTVAYCAVDRDGRTFEEQLFMRDAAVAPLRALTDAVHAEGAAASIQLGHCGGFSKNRDRESKRPLGPSRGFNAYGVFVGLPMADAMTESDMARTRESFVRASLLAREAGFDAVELHLGHGYLLSQFISPHRNKRRDAYGGDLEGRMRFPREVVRAVREAMGPTFPIIAKINLEDGVPGGITAEDAVEQGRMLEADGVSALLTSGGLVSHSAMHLLRGGRPLREMIEVEKNPYQKWALRMFGPVFVKPVPFEPTFFFDGARALRDAVDIPIVLLGGVTSMEDIDRAMDAGFEMVAMGRALIHEPTLPAKYLAGEARTSGCSPCNVCITEMDRPGGVLCALREDQRARREREVEAGEHRRVPGA